MFSLALDKEDAHENERLKSELGEFFYIEKCPLGENPHNKLPQTPAVVAASSNEKKLVLCVVAESEYYEKQRQSIQEKKKFAIALKETGAVLRLVEGFTKANYLLIHNNGDKKTPFVLNKKGPILVPGAKIGEVPNSAKGADFYLVYDIVNVQAYLGDLASLTVPSQPKPERYSPLLVPLSVLQGNL